MAVILYRVLLLCVSFCIAAMLTQLTGLIFVSSGQIQFCSGGIEQIPIGVFLYFSFLKIDSYASFLKRREKMIFFVFSVLFCLCTLGGKLIEAQLEEVSLKLTVGTCVSLVACMVSLVGICYYSVIFCVALLWRKDSGLYSLDDKLTQYPLVSGFVTLLKKKPFRVSFLVLLIVWLPYVLLNFPGLFMADTVDQICQTLPELKDWQTFTVKYSQVHQLDENVKINSHHPVAHTLLLAAFLRGGLYIFQSANAGFFAYTLFQLIFTVCCFSYIIHLICSKIDPKGSSVFLLLLLTAFNPYIICYLPVATKDVIFGAFFALLICSLFVLLVRSEHGDGKSVLVPLLMSVVGVILFRNESKIILLLFSVAGFLMCPRLRKQMAGVVFVTLGTVFLLHVAYDAFSVTPGSRREMLSLPFQQTARFCIKYPEDVSEQEKTVINKVLDVERFYQYCHSPSDGIKDTFRETASNQELCDYFHVWAKMFFKHPRIYMEATVLNHYIWLYVSSKKQPIIYKGTWSQVCMEGVSAVAGGLGYNFTHYPFQQKMQKAVTRALEIASVRGIGRAVFQTATYVWTMLFLSLFVWCRKCRKAAFVLLYPLLTLAILPLGPCNGEYTRYMIPIVFSFPFLLFAVLFLTHAQNENDSHSHPLL